MSRLVSLSVFLMFAAALSAQEARRPNIVYIFSDDHAQRAISAYGEGINQTPNIDRIAREGVTFTQSFCANSICAPSRATVLSGQHSHVNGKMTNGDRFDPRRSKLPLALQKAGYRTALFGKWHLRCDPMGFDDWEVLPGQGSYYNPDFRNAKGRFRRPGYVTELITERALTWLRERSGEGAEEAPFLLMVQHKAPHRNWMPGPRELDLYRDENIPEPATLFDDWSRRAGALGDSEMSIDRHLFWHYDLKVPPALQGDLPGPIMGGKWARNEWDRMDATQRRRFEAAYRAENEALAAAQPKGKDLVRWKYQRYVKDYLRCVAGVDRSVGEILDELDRQGLTENTLVVYSSDQGFYLGEHGWYDKRWIFEESLRMPLLMRWPGRIEKSTQFHLDVQNIDHAPTLLDAAGVAEGRKATQPFLVEYEGMQGRSLLPAIADHAHASGAWRQGIYYAYYEVGIHAVEPHDGVRYADRKLAWFPREKIWRFTTLGPDGLETLETTEWDSENDPMGIGRSWFAEMTRLYAQKRSQYGASAWPAPSNLFVYNERGVPRRDVLTYDDWTFHLDQRFRWNHWSDLRSRLLKTGFPRAVARVRGKLTRSLLRRSQNLEVAIDVEEPYEEGEQAGLGVEFSDGSRRKMTRGTVDPETESVGYLESSMIGWIMQRVAQTLDAAEMRLLDEVIAADYPGELRSFARARVFEEVGGWCQSPELRNDYLSDWSPEMRRFFAKVAGIKINQRSR
jgi:arylsulfatase A-like enzyme